LSKSKFRRTGKRRISNHQRQSRAERRERISAHFRQYARRSGFIGSRIVAGSPLGRAPV
jgi:hypothetical protein